MHYAADALGFNKIKSFPRPLLHVWQLCMASQWITCKMQTNNQRIVISAPIHQRLYIVAECPVAPNWQMPVRMTWSYSLQSLAPSPLWFAKLQIAKNQSSVESRPGCQEIYGHTQSAPKSEWWRQNGKQTKTHLGATVQKDEGCPGGQEQFY